MKITQQLLKELYFYNPINGLLYWKKSGRGRFIGKVAGTIDYDGYVRVQFEKKAYKAHRLAWMFMYGEFPENNIDHINGDKADNRILNLRDVGQDCNSKNSKKSALNTSGTTGVTWDKNRKKWIAQIKVDYKNKHLGRYNNKKDAIQVRKEAEKKYGFHENHGRVC